MGLAQVAEIVGAGRVQHCDILGMGMFDSRKIRIHPTRPLVILTSNGTRDLSDALRRRCLLCPCGPSGPGDGIGDPSAAPAARIVAFVQELRREALEKKPAVAEMLDFAAALAGLGVAELTDDPAVLKAALATLIKTRKDRAEITTAVAQPLTGRAA